MSKIKFILGRRNNTNLAEPQYLEAYIYGDGKKMYKSIGIKLMPEEWDAKKQMVIRRPDRDKLNTDLISIRAILQVDPNTKISLFQLNRNSYDTFNKYYNHCLCNDFRIQTSTYVDQKRTLDLLNEFGLIHFNQINVKFLNEWDSFLTKKKYARNTIAKHHKNLEKFIHKAFQDRLLESDPYEYFTYQKFSQQFAIYLTMEELDLIINAPGLTEDEKIVRDVFLVSAFTALRYSDVIRLDKSYVSWREGKAYIKIITQKTNEYVVIPASPLVVSIMDYYSSFTNLRNKDNAFFNENIKKIAKKAGITEIVNYVSTAGNERTTIQKPKYELISMHTGRRSGATNMFLSGIPAINIMKITGHKTESMFMKYILIDKDHNANILSDNPFFTKTYKK